MRAGLSSIQQTLTPEASTVLNHSIAEAGRHKHGQTTPLHVAATLLSSPSGFLRHACIRSHPNSSHPLQCRALELCFKVALERLPTAQSAPPATEPPISNALMAALKRAQAHQRRGCPEQQQQPLLAVKVELEQLVISILDDPSVSRVMREASFSSPAVKATIEQSLNNNTNNTNTSTSTSSINNHHPQLSFGGIGQRMMGNNPTQLHTNPPPHLGNRNLYLNPRLQQGVSGNLSQSTTPTPTPTPSLGSGNLYLNPAQFTTPRPPLGNQSLYLNPRLQQQGAVGTGAGERGEEVKKVLEIMAKRKKKNPILVGDSEPEAVVKEFLRKLENKELGSDGILKNVEVVSMDKGSLSDRSHIPAKIKELGGVIEGKIGSGGKVILDLGDLKWLVEQPQVSIGGSEMGRAAVVEMTTLLSRFGGENSNNEDSNSSSNYNNNNKLWLIGTATCETYLRCQVYHSTMENDWDLQAVPITSRSPLPGKFPRILSNPLESLNPSLKAVPTPLPALTKPVPENLDHPGQKTSTFCPQCSENYDKELARLAAIEKSFSEAKQDSTRPSLPQWLQNAKINSTDHSEEGKDQGPLSKNKTQELEKKWKDTCLHLHPNFHQNTRSDRSGPPALSMPSLYNPNLISRPPFQPKLQTTKPLGEALQLNMSQVTSQTRACVNSPPGSPVRTDLVLGRNETVEKDTQQNQAKDFLCCISSEPAQNKLLDKFANALDADTYKKLLKGLMEKAWWQAEAATAVASAITRCSLGNGKRRGAAPPRGDVWLLFTGPDRVGKKKMATVLADQINGASPIMICLATRRDNEESDTNFRGKTVIDRIAEAVRRNPFSVVMLEDIDEADMLVRGSIKRAIERGRLTDSHGREVGLGNAVFVLTGDWSTTSPEAIREGHFVDEKKLASIASGNWQLGLIVREKNNKRRPNWLVDRDRSLKQRREMGSSLSLDLNLAGAAIEDSSSELTIDQEDEIGLGLVNQQFSITSVPHDLANNVDDSIVFKPVDSAFVKREIKKTISVKFSMVVDDNIPIEVGNDVLEKILGGLWHDRTSLEQWVENVLAPSFEELKQRLPTGDRIGSVVRLVVESDSGDRGKNTGDADWLPSSIL
ncbi:hypothetical protein RD792_008191, partial [Penstemon davidsonii]